MEPFGKLNAKHFVNRKTGNHRKMGWASMMTNEKEENEQTDQCCDYNHKYIIPQKICYDEAQQIFMTVLSADFVFEFLSSSVLFNVFDDFFGNVSAGNFFNTKSWRSVYFKN